MKSVYQKEMNRYNQFTDLHEIATKQLEEMRAIYEAVGPRVSTAITVKAETQSETTAATTAMVEHFDRTPRNQVIMHTMEALNRNRLSNQLFLLQLQEITTKSNQALTLTERFRLSNEIRSMTNEAILAKLATLEIATNTRAALEDDQLRERMELLERRRERETAKSLVK
jgi:hypothetical protein